MVPLKYLSNFCKTLEMPLINREINLILTCYTDWYIIDAPIADQISVFTISDKKRNVSVVTLLQQLKSGFKRAINWNKYQSKVTWTKPTFRLLNWSNFLGSK